MIPPLFLSSVSHYHSAEGARELLKFGSLRVARRAEDGTYSVFRLSRVPLQPGQIPFHLQPFELQPSSPAPASDPPLPT